MRKNVIAILFALLAIIPGFAQDVEVRVITHENGERVLIHEVVVPAPFEDVWEAYTTKEGLETWAVPKCEIDFRSGGTLKSRYDLDGEIGDAGTVINFIVNFIPWKMITLQSPLGKGFPESVQKASANMYTIVEFNLIDESHTLLTAYETGFLSGQEWDNVLKFFEEGNTQAYQMLVDRFVKGPVDWQKLLKP